MTLAAYEGSELNFSELHVSGNPALKTIDLPALTKLNGGLTISGNSALPSVSMPALTSTFSLDIVANAALARLDLPVLTTVVDNWYGVTIVANPVLPQCQAEALVARLVGFNGPADIRGNDTAAACP